MCLLQAARFHRGVKDVGTDMCLPSGSCRAERAGGMETYESARGLRGGLWEAGWIL